MGLWVGESEGAKFWLSVLTELKNRGVQDILIAAVDGLKGFPEAIESVYPKTQIQLCIVHMVRNSLRYVPWKERKDVAPRPADGLRGRDPGGRRGGPGRVRGAVGRSLPDDRRAGGPTG